MNIKVDNSRCNLCGLCVGICPVNAISTSNAIVEIGSSCVDCGKCLYGCPNDAFSQLRGSKDYGDFTLAIIGGGPAGMTAAYHASQLGIKTILIEKKRAIEFPLSCAEGISVEGFKTSGIDIRPEWVNFHIEGGCLVSPAGRKTVLHHPNAGYMLGRRKMLTDIATEATKQGAKIIINAELVDISQDKKRITFIERGVEASASTEYIIAADGIEGSVKRCIGLSQDRFTVENIHSAAQFVVAGIDIDPSYPIFYLGEKIAPGGYLWVFPKGDGIANIGLGLLPSEGRHAAEFLCDFIDKNFAHYSILEQTGGMVPADPVGTLIHDNILFVGDSANLTDPLSGGGIAHAFLSARVAVETINEALNGGEEISAYKKRIMKLLGKKLKFYRRLRLLFERLNDRDFEDICDFVHQNFDGRTSDGLDITGTFLSLLTSHTRLLRLMRKL